MEQQDVKIDIAELFRFILQGLLPALLIGGAAAYLALQLANRQEPVYEAQATVLAAQTNAGPRDFGLPAISAPPLDVEAYRTAATTDPVLADALQRMGLGEAALSDIRGLRGDIRVEAQDTRSSSLIHIFGEGATPSAAANRANAVANALVDWDRQRASAGIVRSIEQLESTIASLTDQIRALQTMNDPSQSDQIVGLISRRAQAQEDLSYARALAASATPLLTVIQPASPPVTPVSPRPLFNAAIAFFLATVLTYGVLLIRRSLDTRLRGVEDLAHVTGLPVLAEFPRVGRGDRSALREPASYLRTNLLFATADAHPKVLLITSAQMGEGKSVTAAGLAEGFVRNGYRTLLVDADLRSPSVAKLYRIPAGRGRSSLVDWLKDPYEGHAVVDVTLGPGQLLQVVPVFQPVAQPAELLSMGFRSCLEKWRQEFDVVVIDTAPILAVADTLAIAPYATGTVLVTHLTKTNRNQARTAVDLLRRVGVRVLGVAATHVPNGGSRHSYGYGYGSPVGDQQSAQRAVERPLPRPASASSVSPSSGGDTRQHSSKLSG